MSASMKFTDEFFDILQYIPIQLIQLAIHSLINYSLT